MASFRRPELVFTSDHARSASYFGDILCFHMAKLFKPKMVDDMTPAGLSARRREHWESREQAAAHLSKRFL
jgi:hypothetical protein